ncbi:MFS transporter (macronuclear) [Tetrahymena thermophila SB210]|uniref:MFS transporter n=1 Tax=Tetrahymena thermophila (strain SB210) TaxID=312017 RepID=I7M834_TETTS|nr:MFS transporter [Tetrahymena thermophila SB210]EAR96526.1 MFS transporter [Tetrahymena thermophila SB210]|eukprot:XP_001016771.1 MFS transporter [Tetrahymena thermophila SB210]
MSKQFKYQHFNQDNTIPEEQCQIKKLSIQEALEQVGSQHTYQKRFFLFSGFVSLFGATCILSPIFTYEKPSFHCPLEIKSDECENWVCQQPEPSQYFSSQPKSFIMQFNPPLLCDRQYIADLLIAINYAGSALGFIASLYIADNIGRKFATVLFWILAGVGALVSSIFSDDIVLSVFGFALSQFGANSTINIIFCMINDHSLGKFRQYTMAAISPFYGLGGSLLVLFKFISEDYKVMMLFIGIPILISCLYLQKIQDPPLFLYEKDKLKTVEVLNYIAQINKRDTITKEQLQDKQIEVNKNRIYGIRDLFVFPSLRLNSIFSGLILFFIQISYYGSNLTLSQFGFDIKSNALATSIADTIGYIAIIPFVPYFKRKYSCIISGLIFSCIMISFNFIQIPQDCSDVCYEKTMQAILVALARFFLSFEWGIAFIYFTEMFPITVRTVGLGFASFVGEFGSILCSYFISSLIKYGVNPLFGIGIISLFSLLLYYPIDETFSKPIQNEIKELVEVELQKKKQII